jgi:hypothetical protein
MSMTLPRETLLKFLGRVFVETGTNNGDCVALALECGFERVVSIELSEHFYRIASERFAGDRRVSILHGDSAAILADAIRHINEPITFWLDGHAVPGMPTTAAGKCPVLAEIAAIGSHHIKTHAILVDDVSCFGTPVLDDIPIGGVRAAISAINPAYAFSLETGKQGEDVLAATVRTP